MEKIQKEIRGIGNRIDPQYPPFTSPETYQGKPILVIWIPGVDLRPYQAPKNLDKGSQKKYYIRQGSETIEAHGALLTKLMQMTARVPFDDRRNLTASTDSISLALVKNFLSDIKSDLVALGVTHSDQYLLDALKITAPVNSHEVPRNVALLFFVDDPEKYFPGARIEIAQFRDEAGGDLIEEQIFRGPIQSQIRQALAYLNSLSTSMVQKIPNQAIANRTVAFPYEAMEEALVNAVYHRSYDGNPEPTKVYLYPDRLEIISYPGPVEGIYHHNFQPGARIPKVPSRNRRIGDFLKDLKLAEARGTGIPKIRRKMTENGSPDPIFEFDERTRTYFCVTLPAHPQYVVIHALREAAHLWAIGERQRAIAHLEAARQRVPSSGALIAQTIEYRAASEDLALAEQIFREVKDDLTVQNRHLPYSAMAKTLLDQGEVEKAKNILEKSPQPIKANESLGLAILYKRAGDFQSAHRLFKENYDFVENEPKFLHEYAQVKNKLAAKARNKKAK
ncbi:MAG: ATP-binding protein, partial [Spirulinaceae cyanobacterium]